MAAAAMLAVPGWAAAQTLPAAAVGASRGGSGAPTSILVNGDVRLMDRRSSRAAAVAIRGDGIQAVGTTREIQRLAGPSTKVIDLAGRTALPGINDSHVHGLAAGVSLPPLSLDVSFPTVTSIAQIVAAVAAAVQGTPAGAWIRGSGWNTAQLDETRQDPVRPLTAADLDPVSPNNPVVLRDFSFHTVWANSAAMAAAGITASTPTPPGGVIDRDAAGNPTGLFRENAQPLILEALPALSTADQRSGLLRAVDVLLSQGITSYTDPGLTADEIAVYRDASTGDGVKSRITLMLSSSRSLNVGGTGGGSTDLLSAALQAYPHPQVFSDRRLNLRGVKIFGDGIPPNLTAWVSQPYLVGGGFGELVVAGDDDQERANQIMAIVDLAHRSGYQVGTHATGDRTIDLVTSAYIQSIRNYRRNHDPRHYTIHSDLATDNALRQLARYGLGANMNPSIKAAIADAMIGVLGPERAARQWPTRSALRAGATLTAASDWPVTPPDWRAGVVSAVLRKDAISGNVSGPDQSLTIDEAIRAYTVAPAYQDGAERWKGQLERGMAADICVLDGKLPDRDQDIEQLAQTPIAMTIFNGEIAYERPTTATAPTVVGAALTGACAHGATCCCQRAPELLSGWA